MEGRLRRRTDWPTRLMSVIDGAMDKPFRWGTNDCCLFACNCIQAMTDVDPAAHFRGRYDDRQAATKMLREYGGTLETVIERISADLKFPKIEQNFAKRGDFALIANEYGDAMAILYGGAWLYPAQVGLGRHPVGYAVAAWAVC